MSYPTTSSASDVWSLRDAYKAEAGDNWPALSEPLSVDYLIIAGGGGGGEWQGGGGGAGGYLTGTSL